MSSLKAEETEARKFTLLVQRPKDYPKAEPECDPGLVNAEDLDVIHHTSTASEF